MSRCRNYWPVSLLSLWLMTHNYTRNHYDQLLAARRRLSFESTSARSLPFGLHDMVGPLLGCLVLKCLEEQSNNEDTQKPRMPQKHQEKSKNPSTLKLLKNIQEPRKSNTYARKGLSASPKSNNWAIHSTLFAKQRQPWHPGFGWRSPWPSWPNWSTRQPQMLRTTHGAAKVTCKKNRSNHPGEIKEIQYGRERWVVLHPKEIDDSKSFWKLKKSFKQGSWP